MNLKSTRELRKAFFTDYYFFLITLIILDQLFGNLLRILYFKQNHGAEYKTTYTFEKVNSDILIIGSSRAEHHYDSQIFEDSLNMSCYNSGEGGKFIFYYDAVLKCAFEKIQT